LRVELSNINDLSWDVFRKRKFYLWRYRELIPIPLDAEIFTLYEGGTPLVEARRLGSLLHVRELYIKFEGSNPTGSFKDRGMTVAVSMAKYLGAKGVVCASTGNTSSSMAAYARRAGIKPLIIVPKGGITKGKMSQGVLYGATVIEISGGFDEAMSVVLKLAKDLTLYPLNSINPWRIEGQKTVAYEIADELGVPDWIAIPVGNGGNITALWKGFKELKRLGLVSKLPRILGVQAEGASPIVNAFKFGIYKPVIDPTTIASAIRIGNPVHWERALNALTESRGYALSVSDQEIIEAQRMIARLEGLGVEPASASSIAGLYKAVELGIVGRDDTVVAIATGHALKDPDSSLIHDAEYYEVSDSATAIELINKLVSG